MIAVAERPPHNFASVRLSQLEHCAGNYSDTSAHHCAPVPCGKIGCVGETTPAEIRIGPIDCAPARLGC